MFKRRDYKLFHNNDDGVSSSSDSSSESESEGNPREEPQKEGTAGSSEDDGYGSISAEESEVDSDDDKVIQDEEGCRSAKNAATPLDNSGEELFGSKKKNRKGTAKSQWASLVDEEEEERKGERALERVEGDGGGGGLVLRMGPEGRVLKCRICPKILCLSEASMNEHKKSKLHLRSLKKVARGQLGNFLNSDGELEEEVETHTERLERIRAATELRKKKREKRKSVKGRQRQHKRAALKAAASSNPSDSIKTESRKRKEGPGAQEKGVKKGQNLSSSGKSSAKPQKTRKGDKGAGGD